MPGVRGESVRPDADRLRQLQELFAHYWELKTLLCLTQGPQRHKDIATALRQRSTEHLGDGALNRTLTNLRRHGLVSRAPTVEGHTGWELTNLGRRRVALLEAILTSVESINDGPQEASPSPGQ